jgi:hypothetical protein
MIEEAKSSEMYTFSFWWLFLPLTLLYIVLSYITNTYVFTSDFYQTLLQGTLDEERITHTIEARQKLLWVGYAVQPLLLLAKCGIFSAAIYVGTTLFNQAISYKNCLKIVIQAELVTFLSTLVKVSYFLLNPSVSPKAFQYFFPLCVTQLLDVNTIPRYFIYPLSLLNVFELAYWVVLALGVKYFSGKPWGASIKIVAATYGIVLLIWILVIVFISLQFN